MQCTICRSVCSLNIRGNKISPHSFQKDRLVCVCDKDKARIICRSVYSKQAHLQNLVTYDMQHTMCRSENSKWAPFFNTCKIYFFETLNLAFKMAFLHGSLNQMVHFLQGIWGCKKTLVRNRCDICRSLYSF